MIHVRSILHIGSSNTENVVLLVVLFEGGTTQNVNSNCKNLFICIKDIPYINDTTKRPLCPNQKPIKFLKRIIELFSEEDDRIIDVTPRIGKLIYLDIPVITDYT